MSNSSPNNDHRFLVGVISDTHGKLSQAVRQTLEGADMIIHAGDLHTPQILTELETIAPVKAVRGNMDRQKGVRHLPASDVVQIGEVSIYVLHNLEDLDIHPGRAGFQAVIYGHSHKPSIQERKGVLFINPGSPVMPRGGAGCTVARLYIQGKTIQAEIVRVE